jgi:hypothetical protein
MSEVAIVKFSLEVEPDDVVTGLDENDERIFMFIWDMLEDGRVGVEVKQRLLSALTEDLTASGNHPDFK